MKFVLTITTDYVKNWGRWEAVREILQNAIDQSKREGGMSITEEDGELIITTDSGRLERKSLLLGYTDKKENEIGQFGEGYKLALLVLCRLGHEVTIYMGKEIWKSTIEFHDGFQAEVLTIEIIDNNFDDEVSEEGVKFIIKGLSKDVYEDKYLPELVVNTILMDHIGDVFVEGLFVCHINDMKEGYNFSSDRVKLDRDRGMVSDFDLRYEASRLWKEQSATKQYELLESGYRYAEYIDSSDEDILNIFKTKYGEQTIPVSTQSEIREMTNLGMKFQLVPDKLRRVLRSIGKFVFRYKDPPLVRLQKFKEKYSHCLPAEGKEYLEGILKDLIS